MAVLLTLFELLKAYLEQGFKIPGGRGLLKRAEFVERSRSGQLWLRLVTGYFFVSRHFRLGILCGHLRTVLPWLEKKSHGILQDHPRV